MPTPSRRDWSKTLCYQTGGTWRPLPHWALSLIEIGWKLEDRPASNERVALVIVVPDRRFAAALLGLGHILAQAVPFPTKEELDLHFDALLALPDPVMTPTPLIYLSDGRSYRGVHAGVRQVDGQPRISVCVQERASDRSGGATYFIDRARAGNLHVDPEPHNRLGRNVNGRSLSRSRSFAKQVYDSSELGRLHIFARPTLLLIGRLNALRNEILYEDFATRDKKGAYQEGVLNDLLKVDRFLASSLRARTCLIPAAAEESIVKAGDSPSKLVIFDGADTHLRWCHHFKATDAVSIFSL